jgi:ribosomal-protein-alanine N-acetyltransferase
MMASRDATKRIYVRAPMQSDDVPDVSQLERRCFTNPWPESAYYRELREPERNYYIVLREELPVTEQRDTGQEEGRGRLALLPRLRRPVRAITQPLVGFAGMWVVSGEAHVTTIAVAPEHRRHGLGEALFLALLGEAIRRGGEVLTLEVRVSNLAAQALYEKYGLTRQGLRPRYYSDNAEDAYIMTSPSLRDVAYRERLLQLGQRLAEKLASQRVEILERAG